MVAPHHKDMEHLQPSALKLLDASNEDRIRSIRSAKWITYPNASEALLLLDDIWQHPKHHRMPCALIWGETNNGKTLLSHRFRRQHPSEDDPSEDSANVPVFVVQMPAEPTVKAFLVEILRNGFVAYKDRSTVATLKTNAMNLLKICGTKVLVIDEFHNVLGVSGTAQRTFLALIRYLTNELQISIVCFGTKKALLPFRHDEQLSNRFTKFELPHWKYDRDTLRYLNSLERLLPLRRRSNLAQPAIAKRLVNSKIQSIGEITDFVKLAAIQAIRDGSEIIDNNALDRCRYVPPGHPSRKPPIKGNN